MGKLIINGNQVYEIDEDCMKKKERAKQEMSKQQRTADEEVTPKNGKRLSRR